MHFGGIWRHAPHVQCAHIGRYTALEWNRHQFVIHTMPTRILCTRSLAYIAASASFNEWENELCMHVDYAFACTAAEKKNRIKTANAMAKIQSETNCEWIHYWFIHASNEIPPQKIDEKRSETSTANSERYLFSRNDCIQSINSLQITANKWLLKIPLLVIDSWRTVRLLANANSNWMEAQIGHTPARPTANQHASVWCVNRQWLCACNLQCAECSFTCQMNWLRFHRRFQNGRLAEPKCVWAYVWWSERQHRK